MRRSIFGTSGIRGIVNQDLTPDFCKGVGMALGTILPPGSAVCLATDSRLSRELIKQAVIQGLSQCEINIADMGIAPTPVLALVTREMGFDAGVMITASHNPPNFNGIKLFNSNAIGFDRDQEIQLEEMFYSGKFRTGKPGHVDSVPAMKWRYFDFIQQQVNNLNFNRSLKLIIDAGNGAAAGLAGEIFKKLGFTVISINDTPDGRFPVRSPEPKEDTLQGTIAFLRQKNADLAICFDGDADRVVFCDQQGFLGFNEMIGFISRNLVKQTGKNAVATTVETGLLLDLAVKDLDGKVIRGKVGDVYAAHLARKYDAAIGVEAVGVYIIPSAGYYPDSILASLMLLSSISNIGEIRDYLSTLPRLYFSKDKIPCPHEFKDIVMEKIKQKAHILNSVSINELDGLRFEYGDAWMLIRASGTEPAIRVIAESRTCPTTERLLQSGISLVRDIIKEANQ